MIFTRHFHARRSASRLALALALASGAAIATTALAPQAYAQDDEEEEAAQPNFSEGFVAAYQPVAPMVEAEGTDIASLKAQIPAVIAAVQTPDDRQAAGNLVYAIGRKAQDMALQLQGLELMIDSGKLSPENIGPYAFQAGQTAYQLEDYAKARALIMKAVEAGYNQNSPEALIAETYFAENNFAEGLAYLDTAIEARVAAGQPIDEQWIRRGLSIAYNNQLADQAGDYALLFVENYPSDTSWGDAIAIMLNTGSFEGPETLDLLRLARRAGTMRDANMYVEYVQAADYRRLPGEVVAVIEEGYSSGKLPRDNAYVADTLKEAQSRAAADRADLESIASGARASGADLTTVLAAADIMLSYGRGAEAEEFYTKALSMPGVDTAEVQTRLGIAQLDQGKYAEAQASFAKVTGPRERLAGLWALWAKQKAGGGAAATAGATS